MHQYETLIDAAGPRELRDGEEEVFNRYRFGIFANLHFSNSECFTALTVPSVIDVSSVPTVPFKVLGCELGASRQCDDQGSGAKSIPVNSGGAAPLNVAFWRTKASVVNSREPSVWQRALVIACEDRYSPSCTPLSLINLKKIRPW